MGVPVRLLREIPSQDSFPRMFLVVQDMEVSNGLSREMPSLDSDCPYASVGRIGTKSEQFVGGNRQR